MDRKKFIKKLGLGVAVTPLIPVSLISCSSNNEVVKGNETSECGVTKSDVLGPYYVSGTAKITNLNTQNLPGDKIVVTGKIFGAANKTNPIANAMIEVWHADGGGTYHPVGNGDVSNFAADKITLRGFVTSDAEGKYTFESIRPGLYPGRPRHFHYKITANGYKTLVTQIYFTGDARTADENIDSCRIIDFKKDNQNVYKGNSDIHLEAN